MYKLYPNSREVAQRLISILIAGDCSFAVSGDSGKFEIRGMWSASFVNDLMLNARVKDEELEIMAV